MQYCSIGPCRRMMFQKDYCLNHWHELIPKPPRIQLDRRFTNGLVSKHRREYNSWYSMLRRCYAPTDANYKYYGALGVTVCDRWIDDFADFYADMGSRPEGTSIDRINPFGNYEPANCRWATAKIQANNKRSDYK